MANLVVSKELSLPLEAVTETFGILAKRGAGKSNAAVVMAEEMYKHGLHWVALDPKDDWWGIRSGSDGKSPGLPVVIFGGRHGDLPIEPGAGQLLADVVVNDRLTCVVVTSEFTEAEKIRFLDGFADRLFRKKHEEQDPTHLFLEEADDYIPQRVVSKYAHVVYLFEKIVKQGRARGLGCTLITQRSAVINKNVLTQIETLFALRTSSPQDRKAIEGWVEYHAERADILESLAGLDNGEAWVWSPHFLKTGKRIQFRMRATLDSAATPKVKRARRAPTTLADVDLGALQTAMAETIERAKADDPKELRRRIAQLEREAAKQPASTEPKIERVEVPVFKDGEVGHLEKVVAGLSDIGTDLHAVATEISSALTAHIAREVLAPRRQSIPARPTSERVRSRREPHRRSRIDEVEIGEANLRAGERRILEVLARHYPMKVTRAQLGTLSRFTPSGGTFTTYFGTLRRHGLIEVHGGLVEIAQAGMDYLGEAVPQSSQTTQELLDIWRSALRAGERSMLDELVEVYPDAVTREELAERTGFTASGGTFTTYLGTLRRNGLVDVTRTEIRASETLFLSGVP